MFPSHDTNEGLLTIASIAIALPAIMGLVAKFGKVAGDMVNKVLGKKPTDEGAYQQWMNKLGHIADELHHLYMAPIEAIVKKFVKDEAKAKKIARLTSLSIKRIPPFQFANVSSNFLILALTSINASANLAAFVSSNILRECCDNPPKSAAKKQ